MGPRFMKNLRRRAGVNELPQQPGYLRGFFPGGQFPIGKGSGTPFSETYIAFGLELPL
jgi:hypothetical protein